MASKTLDIVDDAEDFLRRNPADGPPHYHMKQLVKEARRLSSLLEGRGVEVEIIGKVVVSGDVWACKIVTEQTHVPAPADGDCATLILHDGGTET